MFNFTIYILLRYKLLYGQQSTSGACPGIAWGGRAKYFVYKAWGARGPGKFLK